MNDKWTEYYDSSSLLSDSFCSFINDGCAIAGVLCVLRQMMRLVYVTVLTLNLPSNPSSSSMTPDSYYYLGFRNVVMKTCKEWIGL